MSTPFYSLIIFFLRNSQYIAVETSWLSQGTMTQGPVLWTWQHGISWASLQLARGALMTTVWFISRRLVVSNTRFQHPQRHLVTWFSNVGRNRNQIYRMLVRSHWASSVIDCQANIVAQTGSEHDSDHAMVRARLRLSLKAARIPNHPAKFNMAKLKTAALEHLRMYLRNRFQGLHLDEDATPEDEWR